MTWRLILGVMMMERRSILSALLMTMFMSRSSAAEWLMGGAVVLFVGAISMSAPDALATRTFSVLPLSARDISRATWLLLAGLPVAILTLGRVLSASIFAPFGDEWSWVFPATPVRVFYECLFFAVIGAWTVLVPDRHAPDYREDSGLYLVVLAVLGMMAVPFILLRFLPAGFDGISPLGWVLTGVAVVLAATPLFLPPKQFVRPDPPRRPLETPQATLVTRPASALAVPTPRLTGVWALMPQVMKHATAWSAGFITFQLALQWTRDSQPVLQPFAPDMPAARFMVGVCFLMVFVIGMMPGLGQRVPMLRLLPIPATRAATALTLAPVVTPVVFWTALILMHVAVSSAWPSTLRLKYLVLLAGLAAVVDALGIKAGSQRAKAAIGFLVTFALLSASNGDRAWLELVLTHWLVPAVGVASLVAAYVLNLHTMTRMERGSRAYRYGQSDMAQRAR